ncbi:hypothetical protein TIFTF001_024464 [Ficus carica]|uniref:Uncharacterized protein n=1 Tax=Ficus carica TaxID=3494 RepID=A0AA88ALF6_FICCA|nr:hypothetical protein TIFTF001_024464 [Ficus carica]
MVGVSCLYKDYQLECNTMNDFPDNFIFGTASAAYQYEGATDVDGRKPSIWDTFTEQHPEKIEDGSSGKIADEFYYLYRSDIVDKLKVMGFDSFRFSFSWSRILPYGTMNGGENKKGVQFYHSLIQTLIDNDLFSIGGYEDGEYAPGRCSHYAGNCTSGNSAIEPYLVMHHILLAHAEAVDLYWNQYKVADSWMFIYPKGIEDLVMYVNENYNNPTMYITENGVQDPSVPEDKIRIKYYRRHLWHLLQAIKMGANVKGFYAWTLLDDFEWSSGYTLKFGLYDVNRKTMKRTPKASVDWFTIFLKPEPKIVDYGKLASSSLLSGA